MTVIFFLSSQPYRFCNTAFFKRCVCFTHVYCIRKIIEECRRRASIVGGYEILAENSNVCSLLEFYSYYKQLNFEVLHGT